MCKGIIGYFRGFWALVQVFFGVLECFGVYQVYLGRFGLFGVFLGVFLRVFWGL